MGGDQDRLAAGDLFKILVFERAVAAGNLQKRVDHGIARHDDILFTDPVVEKVGFRRLGRRQMQGGELRGQPAVDLFREGIETISGAQARFQMN